MRNYSLIVFMALICTPAFAGYFGGRFVSNQLAPEEARPYIRQLANQEGRLATAKRMLESAEQHRQLTINNYADGPFKTSALARNDREIADQKASVAKIQGEIDEAFGKWAPSRRNKMMEKVGEAYLLERERAEAWANQKHFIRAGELKRVQADLEEATEKFLETVKELKVSKRGFKFRGKAGLAGAAIAATAIVAEVSMGSGEAKAGELKAEEFQMKSQPENDRSDVTIGAFDAE